jgi:hypothetical protein
MKPGVMDPALWEAIKALQPTSGVRAAISQRKTHPCTCTPVKHTRKHHKKTGHCRPGCNCQARTR